MNQKSTIYPFYADYGYVNKVLSETDYISVRVKGRNWVIEKTTNKLVVEDITKYGKTITKEDFTEVFLKALSHANHAYFMEVSDPATDEEMREGADDLQTYEQMLYEDQQNELWERNEGISEAVNELAKIE